jgi:Domain of unknown function (DUF4132)
VNQPAWLNLVPASIGPEYAAELDELARFAEEAASDGDTKLEEAIIAIGRIPAPEEFVRPFRALVIAVDACRQANAQSDESVFLGTIGRWLRRNIPLSRTDLADLLRVTSGTRDAKQQGALLGAALSTFKRVLVASPLTLDERRALQAIAANLAQSKLPKSTIAKLRADIDVICDDSTVTRLHADDGWADQLRAWALGLDGESGMKWDAFLQALAAVQPQPPITDWTVHAHETGVDPLHNPELALEAWTRMRLARVPAAAWRQRMRALIDELGRDTVLAHVRTWLGNVPGSKPGMLVRASLNRELMRGLLWLCPELADPELAQSLQRVGMYFYENNSPLGETTVAVLFHHPERMGANVLAVLQGRVRATTQREYIDATLDQLADRLGIHRADLVDGELPNFGFARVGEFEQTFDTARAIVKITGARSVDVRWTKADGQPLKSIPARVKREFGTEIDKLKTLAKTVRDALSGLSERLENAPLELRQWEVSSWREQMIDHPVAGAIGRRLIWRFGNDDGAAAAIWHDNAWRTDDGRLIAPPASATISLWHPLFAAASEVFAWRDYLEAERIMQPFKQAHREIYVLTDAERATATYSNRFASHIIRQRQFRVLAKARGWKADLVGSWGEQTTRAVRELRRWDLRAEFWVNGTGDQFETGYTYLSTDQVRFYRLGATEPLPLEQVPPLVLSEIMRHVDLFVGVASVGNDPTWQDGGPQGRYRDYWQSYSFGELTGTGTTRKQVLERLVPRLKIAAQCTFSDRFLVVRGSKRTYKIHLGSGNIFMEPNAQYLCIVPNARGRDSQEDLFLPFEGDNTLSIIISKALLLADDAKINDPTITRQIDAR